MRTAILGTALLVTLTAGEAAATPAWCNVDNKEKLRGVSSDSVSDALAKEWDRALYYIVVSSCAPDEDAIKRASEVERARQAWSKTLKMTEADWADVADW